MNPLEKIIRNKIAAEGPLSIAAYMELALQHPVYGYYRARDPLGRTGDFVTAPEVSQLFGEMIGVWCAQTWKELEHPNPFALLELGPGRGSMMRDLLRATAHASGFHDSKKLYLIDSNEVLRRKQLEALGPAAAPQYIDSIDELPPMPTLVIANEFFDALPVRQFEKTFRGWAERMVAVENDSLVPALRLLTETEKSLIPAGLWEALPGVVFEASLQAEAFMRDLCQTLAARKGAALVIDYGYAAPSGSATLQAVSRHKTASLFENPGEVDLTAHVDFTALAAIARHAGLKTSPLLGQGEFLKNWGIEIRADSLKKHATPQQAASLDAGLRRLTDESQMGNLFRVLEIRS